MTPGQSNVVRCEKCGAEWAGSGELKECPECPRRSNSQDLVGKIASDGTAYCLRHVPDSLQSEHHDLHRFEAAWDHNRCEGCGTLLEDA